MNIKPIAYFRSPLTSKFGIPRQSGVVEDLVGEIVFEKEFSSPDAIRGLEGFDYIWLIWGFSANKHTSNGLTVRPPRLGGNERLGVFATRSPFRPNPIGLSCVKLMATASPPASHILEDTQSSTSLRREGAANALKEQSQNDSTINESAPSLRGKSDVDNIGVCARAGGEAVLLVLGADLMDGTPIYDIKPYIPYADAHPDARGGFTDNNDWKPLEVIIPEDIANTFSPTELSSLRGVLSQDPRPQYHNDPNRIYGMPFAGRDVKFKVEGNILTVHSLF